jgi:hypothetical protein
VYAIIRIFLWKNLNNKSKNEFLSKLGLILIVLQLFIFIFIIDNDFYRYFVLSCYVIFGLFVFIYKMNYSPFIFKTTISKNGHFSWNWLNFVGIEKIILFIYHFMLFHV